MLRDIKFDNDFLNSDYFVLFHFEDLEYKSIEAAYQASKVSDFETKYKISKMSPNEAAYKGNMIYPDDAWYDSELEILKQIIKAVFSEADMREKLNNVKSFIGHNMVHDNIYGCCDCPKCKNKMKYNCYGRLLQNMKIPE